YSAILFFVLAFLLYLGRIYERSHGNVAAGKALPAIAAPAAPAPAPAAAAPVTAPAAATPAPAATTPPAEAPKK
ncbi:MAG: preprotein translocase subunit SecG, partial [Opitutaceae bacterium]